MAERVQQFIRVRLGGLQPPDDLDRLLTRYAGDPEFETSDDNPLAFVGAELLWPDKTYPLLDHTYLTDTDRNDRGIMANVNAMTDTAKLLKFVLQLEDDEQIGYWLGQNGELTDLRCLYTLDSEGTYDVAAGETLSESLAYAYVIADRQEAFDGLLTRFQRLGIDVPRRSDTEIFAGMERRAAALDVSPDRYHQMRHDAYMTRT